MTFCLLLGEWASGCLDLSLLGLEFFLELDLDLLELGLALIGPKTMVIPSMMCCGTASQWSWTIFVFPGKISLAHDLWIDPSFDLSHSPTCVRHSLELYNSELF